jgi:hypothetical protein
VTNVRDVHHVVNFVAEEFQSSSNDVREQERTKISDVSKVVDRRPAAIHSHAVGISRLEGFGGVRERVVELDFHGVSVSYGHKILNQPREDSKTARLSAARFSETAPGFSATLRIPVFLGQFWQQRRNCRVVNLIRSVDFSRP